MDAITAHVLVVQKVARVWLACRVRDSLMWEAYALEEEAQRAKDRRLIEETESMVQHERLQQEASEAEMIENHRAYLAKTKAKRNWKKVRLNLGDVLKMGDERAAEEAAAARRRANKPALVPPALRAADEYSSTEGAAVVRVQALYRVYRAKSCFLRLLLAHAERDEAARRAKEGAQVEEAYRLLETEKLTRTASDRAMLRAQSKRRLSLKGDNTLDSAAESARRVAAASAATVATVDHNATAVAVAPNDNTKANAAVNESAIGAGKSATPVLSEPLQPLHCEVVVAKSVRADSPCGSHVTTFAAARGCANAAPSPKAKPQLVRALTQVEIETLKQAKGTLERAGLMADARYVKISRLLAATGQPSEAPPPTPSEQLAASPACFLDAGHQRA